MLLIFSSLVCFRCLLVCLLVYVRGSLGTPGMQSIPPGGDGMGVPGCLHRGQPIWVPGLSFGFPTYSVLKEISLLVLQESL